MSRLLLIDDDPTDLREQISLLLGRPSIDVFIARTEAEGLRLIELHRPDVVLLKSQVHGMSGLEIHKQIRQLDPNIRVFFITPSTSPESALDPIRHGAYEQLVEPLTPVQFEKVLREALKLSHSDHAESLPSSGESFSFESYIRERLNAGSSDLYNEAHLQLDRILLSATLRWVNGNQLHAARILGIARQTLRNRLRELGLIPKSGATHENGAGDRAADHHTDAGMQQD